MCQHPRDIVYIILYTQCLVLKRRGKRKPYLQHRRAILPICICNVCVYIYICECVCVCVCVYSVLYMYNIIIYACGLSTNESYLYGIRPILISNCASVKKTSSRAYPLNLFNGIFFPSARKCTDRRVNVTRHSLGFKTIVVCIIIYYYKRITSMTDAIASYMYIR